MSKKNWRTNLIEDAKKYGVDFQSENNKFLSSEDILKNAISKGLTEDELKVLASHLTNKKQPEAKKQPVKRQPARGRPKKQEVDENNTEDKVKLRKNDRKQQLKDLLKKESLLTNEQIKYALSLV